MVMTHMRSVGFELEKDKIVYFLSEIVKRNLGIFHTTVEELDEEKNLLTIYYDSDFITYDKVVDLVVTWLDLIVEIRG